MNNKNYYLLVLIGLFFSCKIKSLSGIEFTKTSSTPYQPLEKLYTLTNEKFIFNSIIDTNSIYVAQLEMMKPEPPTFFLLRFSNTGICYMITNSNRPFNEFDYNTFTDGQFCRYKIDDKNKITLEFYRYGFRTFVYWYGKVTDDRILFSREKFISRFGGANIEEYIYYKKQAKITKKLMFPK